MTFRPTTLDAATGLAFAGQIASAAYVGIKGPLGEIATHFDWNGQPNGWSTRFELAVGLGGLAILGLLISGGMSVAASRALAAGDVSRARGQRVAQGVTVAVVTAVTGLVLLLTVAHSPQIGGESGVPMAVLAALLAVIGAMIGRVSPNPWVGVRTPWSYKSRLAWDRSNRLVGRLWFFGGLLGLAASPFAPQPIGLQAVIGLAVGAAALAVAESWRVWRTDPDRQPF